MCYEKRRHTRFIHADADAVARYARLCHFKYRVTNAVAIANADLVIRKSFDGEVFSELAESKIIASEKALPIMVGIHLVDKYSALLPSVTGEIGLRIAVDIELAHHHFRQPGFSRCRYAQFCRSMSRRAEGRHLLKAIGAWVPTSGEPEPHHPHRESPAHMIRLCQVQHGIHDILHSRLVHSRVQRRFAGTVAVHWCMRRPSTMDKGCQSGNFSNMAPSRRFSVACARPGAHGEIGIVVARCERLSFPEQTERLLLGVAANQALTSRHFCNGAVSECETLPLFWPVIGIGSCGRPVCHRFRCTERVLGTHTTGGCGQERPDRWR